MREAAKFAKDRYITPAAKPPNSCPNQAPVAGRIHLQRHSVLRRSARHLQIARDIYLKGEVDHVDILFTNFVSTLVQNRVRQLLPIAEIKHVQAGIGANAAIIPPAASTGEFVFEPDQEQVLGALLPHSLNFKCIRFCWRQRPANTAPAWWR